MAFDVEAGVAGKRERRVSADCCPTCGGSVENDVSSARLVRELLDLKEAWESVAADLQHMPAMLEPRHGPSLGRLSGKLELLKRLSLRAAQTADFVARTVTK